MNESTSLTRSGIQPALGWRGRLGAAAAAIPAGLKTVVVLFKLRVVALLLVAALGGALLGAEGRPDGGALFWLLLTGTLSAGGASAVNQYLERERDTRMARTRRRPLAQGTIARPRLILAAGAGSVVLAVALAWLTVNWQTAFFTALGAAIYVGVYTIWLKPRTIVNIVIGGAAGSCTVLSGGAAAGAWSDPGVISLALLVFLWTPVHFWSLAMAYRDDYAEASYPMLPVQVSPRQAAGWVALHTLAAGFAALLLAAHPALGLAYLIPVIPATARLAWLTVRLLRLPEKRPALQLFVYSNAYLGIVLITQMIVSIWR